MIAGHIRPSKGRGLLPLVPRTAAAAAAALVEADDDEDEGTTEVDAARETLVREEPEDAEALSEASVAERTAAEADVARIEGRRSLVGRTAVACVVAVLVAEPVLLVVELVLLPVDCVGVRSPSELSRSFSLLLERGLLSVS